MQDSQAIPARLLKPGLQGCNLLSLQPHPYARMSGLEPRGELAQRNAAFGLQADVDQWNADRAALGLSPIPGLP